MKFLFSRASSKSFISVLFFTLLLSACGGGGGGGSSNNPSSDGSSWTGTKQLGVPGGFTLGNSVTTDANGNIYVAGSTTGSLDGNTLAGNADFFVTKYDSTGAKQYTRQFGEAGASISGNSVTTDANGNVYVAGSTSRGLDGNTQIGSFDFFVTKFDSTGARQFTRQLGVTAVRTFAHSVATDANGNVYVAGETQGGLDGNTLAGDTDFFVTKYDSTGVKQYTRQLGVAGTGITIGRSVATDANGNVYVAGETSGGLDGNTLAGYIDFFVTKYDSTGVKQYTRQLGGEGDTIGRSVATDTNGNVYVVGEAAGGLDGNTLTGNIGFFVTKYDSTGVKQYTRQLEGAAASTGRSVATDANGNVYVVGFTSGDLDGNTLIGIFDSFVTKYNSTGVKQYTRQFGVTAAQVFSNSVATDANSNVYIAGITTGGLDGNTLTGSQDFFVTKYDSTGVKQ